MPVRLSVTLLLHNAGDHDDVRRFIKDSESAIIRIVRNRLVLGSMRLAVEMGGRIL